MKKVYTKPAIVFDSFELAQNIAAGCEFISKHAENSCPVIDPSLGIEILARGTCAFSPPNAGDEICYHAPLDSSNIFTS